MITMITSKAKNLKRSLAVVLFVILCLVVLPYLGMQGSNLLNEFFSSAVRNGRIAFLLSVFTAVCLLTIVIGCIEFIVFRAHKRLVVVSAMLPTIVFFCISHGWALVTNQEWSFLLQYILVFASAVYLAFLSIMLSKSHMTR
jgi:hypothetical protein